LGGFVGGAAARQNNPSLFQLRKSYLG
jgi:hypothetical protein